MNKMKEYERGREDGLDLALRIVRDGGIEALEREIKFRGIVIDAVQWTGTNHREMFDFLTDYQCVDQYMSAEGKNFYIDHWKVPGGLVIKTLEGEHLANIGDYIIRGVHGEFYPCKPDIFRETYEEVEE